MKSKSVERANHESWGEQEPVAPHAMEPAPDSPQDRFARQVGFASYLPLFEASTPLTSAAGKQWLTTALRHNAWIVWNDVDLAVAGTYPTREAAERSLPSPLSRGD